MPFIRMLRRCLYRFRPAKGSRRPLAGRYGPPAVTNLFAKFGRSLMRISIPHSSMGMIRPTNDHKALRHGRTLALPTVHRKFTCG